MDGAVVDRERTHAAVELLARHERSLRITARRFSLCEADADDALQRSWEILLTKGHAVEPGRLVAWMRTVTRNEALAVRRGRERLLGPPPFERPELGPLDPFDLLPCDRPDPLERLLRDEQVTEARRALAGLKRNERTAIALQAEGYSYAEICERCGWTYTKVNRCLAEGRARLRAGPAPG